LVSTSCFKYVLFNTNCNVRLNCHDFVDIVWNRFHVVSNLVMVRKILFFELLNLALYCYAINSFIFDSIMKDPRGVERGKCTKCSCTAYELEQNATRATCSYCECPAPAHEEVSSKFTLIYLLL